MPDISKILSSLNFSGFYSKPSFASYDREIAQVIRDLVKQIPVLADVFKFADRWGLWAFGALAIFALWRYRRLFLELTVTLVLTRAALTEGLLLFYKKQRPSLLSDEIKAFLDFAQPVFPSGLGALYFAVGAAFLFYDRLVGLLVVGFSVVLGAARIYLHGALPSDILAGAVIGIIAAFIVNKVFGRYD